MIAYGSTCRPQSQRPVGDKSPTCLDWWTEPKTMSPPGSRATMVPTNRTMFPNRRAGMIASSMLRLTSAGHMRGNNRATSLKRWFVVAGPGQDWKRYANWMLISGEKDRGLRIEIREPSERQRVEVGEQVERWDEKRITFITG